MIRTFKYKVYASKHTKELSRLVTSSGFLWNHVVRLSKRYYKLYHKSLSPTRLQSHMATRSPCRRSANGTTKLSTSTSNNNIAASPASTAPTAKAPSCSRARWGTPCTPRGSTAYS